MAFLKKVTFHWDKAGAKDNYPFNIPVLNKLKMLDLDHNVTFFIGENGTGKSTLLEAIAYQCGFGNKGGGKYNEKVYTFWMSRKPLYHHSGRWLF